MCKPFCGPLVTYTRIVPGSRLGPDLPTYVRFLCFTEEQQQPRGKESAFARAALMRYFKPSFYAECCVHVAVVYSHYS